MKKSIFYGVIFTLVFLSHAFSAELLNINFTQKGEVSELELLFDKSNVEASKFHVNDDKQIIIDLKNVISKKRVMRAFDTSEFSGSVVFVKSYKRPMHKKDLRIAIQLRDNVRSVIEKKSNRVILKIENRFGVFSKAALDGFKVEKKKSFETMSGRYHMPKSDSLEDILENLTLSGRKKYIGRKISFNVKNLSISAILRMIADASGFNIIQSNDVEKLPPLSLTLTNIPWDQALDTILNLNKLVAKKNGVILIVSTLAKETKDRKIEAAAKQLKIKEEPLVTRVFPVSYADTKDMGKILKEYLTAKRGKISIDDRTNSLIIRDTPKVIEKLIKIVGVLDTQTPQVLIESKIIEVTESYKKEIGLQNGLNFGYDPIGKVGSRVASNAGSSLEPGVDGGPGFSFSSAPSTGEGARSLFGLTVSRFSRLLNLNFTLQMMETEAKGKIIASPKIITQNKKKAELKTKNTTSFSKTVATDGKTETTFEKIDAELKLEVTPQVTNEGSISLEISLSKEQFGSRPSAQAPPDKQSRDIKTTVLVDNGSTIVLGGVYNFEKRETHSGVPFLKDVPLVGWLFRTPYAPETIKEEMMIFITPRIVNQKEAGIGVDDETT